ncbi:MAG: radical SAM family heme chaperone HemW [Candidatus Omnitrophica bacterium]|nr:radical SAM family heme chaperone HemW [Candidatus Omnitrophota bacterium]
MSGLYIHIPFCKNKCIYCNFYSIVYRKQSATEYINILKKQLSNLNQNFSTIYIGGGTPTILDFLELKALLYSLRKFIKNANEITIEANPESLNVDKVKLFIDEGVNRISIGAQSFNDKKLERLGRMHSSYQAKTAISLCKKYGFKNINIDLIFGVFGETYPIWKKDLLEVIKLAPSHVSIYMLTYEKNTPLYKQLQKKLILQMDEELVVKMYKFAINFLEKNGFCQYEISNFAKRNYFCQHNINYWENNPYTGLGPSAFSYNDGVRAKNISCLKEYIEKVKKNENFIAFSEKLKPIRRAKETASLKIRTIEGIDFDWFYKKTGFDFLVLEKEALRMLIKNRLIRYRICNDPAKNKLKVGICLTKKGLLFSDTVSAALL